MSDRATKVQNFYIAINNGIGVRRENCEALGIGYEACRRFNDLIRYGQPLDDWSNPESPVRFAPIDAPKRRVYCKRKFAESLGYVKGRERYGRNHHRRAGA